MKPEDTDLIDDAIRRATEEGRRRLGRAPTKEELTAYRRGELSPEDRDLVEERLAHYPDAVRELLAISASGEPGPAGDAEPLPQEEVEREWTLLQARLGAEREALRPIEAEPRRISGRWALAMAASVLVGVMGLGWGTLAWRSANAPKTGIQDLLLLPDDALRGAGDQSGVRLEPGVDNFLISLKLPDGVADHRRFRMQISRAGSSDAFWSADGVPRGPGGTVFLWLPRSYLDSGAYRIKLFGLEGEAWTPVADYSFSAP